MVKLTIDQREVEVPEGATILDAAQKLGIDIPTLCYRQDCDPSTSCLVCLVHVGPNGKAVPSCATAAVDGMVVESETEAVHHLRRRALELLLSDHLGDCLGPCSLGCPAGMDIPTMLRQIAAGDLPGAIATIKRDIALPAVLGRICPAPCEKVCRRSDLARLSHQAQQATGSVPLLLRSSAGGNSVAGTACEQAVAHGGKQCLLDGAVSICLLKRLAADVDLASPEPYLPPCAASTGKHVAIIGAGPTGLSAAYYLRRHGHDCALFDENDQLGGRLLQETTETDLPRSVLQAEIATIQKLGIDIEQNTRVSLAEIAAMQSRFDAVLLACGATGGEQAAKASLPVSPRGIAVDPHTFAVKAGQGRGDAEKGLFAAGNAIRGKGLVVRSVADGKEAAEAIHQFLAGLPCTGWPRRFNTKMGRLQGDDLARFSAGACDAARRDPLKGIAAGFTPKEGREQAARCLHCDCRGLHSCKLRKYAAQYHADPRHYGATQRSFTADARHAEVIYESGKCIDCGLCIQIAAAAGEPLGMTFLGRGFNVRVAVPFDHSIAEALTKVAAECVAACPTGALAVKKSDPS
jgi:NADPH-dependent glutamate synthase beta subunit-like oxidoreductase/ferredoxin